MADVEIPNSKIVAQVSKPAVSPISKSAGRPTVLRGAGLEAGDTAGLETCATKKRGGTPRNRQAGRLPYMG
jgi:hypothetical protein